MDSPELNLLCFMHKRTYEFGTTYNWLTVISKYMYSFWISANKMSFFTDCIFLKVIVLKVVVFFFLRDLNWDFYRMISILGFLYMHFNQDQLLNMRLIGIFVCLYSINLMWVWCLTIIGIKNTSYCEKPCLFFITQNLRYRNLSSDFYD